MSVMVQSLGPENYDTWVIHARAYLTKNKLWKYIRNIPKSTSQDELDDDEVAKSELLLLISPSELKQVKNCKYPNDVWDTLEAIYASKGPARKANLLKQLILLKLADNGDAKEHLKIFMDIVDKLNDLGIEINQELLSIMMLYSLSFEYENFRIAIESQDNLITPDNLKIKIIEEYESRRRNQSSTSEKTEETF